MKLTVKTLTGTYLIEFYGVGTNTYCNILDENEEPLSQGMSVLGRKDQYVPKVGAKTALTGAIDKLDFSKEVRTQIWNEFNTIKENKFRLQMCKLER
jgi:hypothetical protein